jgi:predicted RNA binding protein YcfA (HicA-like mRNA interferase family)
VLPDFLTSGNITNSVVKSQLFFVFSRLQELKGAGFYEILGGKGSHRKFVHENYAGAVTLSGKIGEDAKTYQEKQVAHAVEQVK